MSLHIFANIVTPFGAAANNRGESEGIIATMQKLVWQGQIHSTVSAEAIRFALRQFLAQTEESGTNRSWNEATRLNQWQDPDFESWASEDGKTFIDDDVMGFMKVEAAKEEGESGSATVRRGVLEVTRAVSLTPWSGDVTFNAASPMASVYSAKRGDTYALPHGIELHATRYQFGLALTPERLREPSRAVKALRTVASLRTVGGNHGRFLYDFSPDSVVLRITDDPAPRFLYCFDTKDEGKTVDADALLYRVASGDIAPGELVLGGPISGSETGSKLREAGVESMHDGVKAAFGEACDRISQSLQSAG